MPRIAIDLTPLRPGGENGGAKVLIWQLLTQLLQQNSPYDYLLLTAVWNDDECAVFDGPRCHRLCVLSESGPTTNALAAPVPVTGQDAFD